jgi:phosphoserine aminotransferase
LFYDTLDAFPEVYTGTVAKEDRSLMNACFVMKDPAAEERFNILCQQEGFVGVKGHRSVGGFRVSLYNALPYESVVALTEVMKQFAEQG